MNKLPERGDRIRLIAMPDDPNPIPSGTVGTVISVDQIGRGSDAWHQIDVAWDNDRMLMLSVPPDRFAIISRDDQ